MDGMKTSDCLYEIFSSTRFPCPLLLFTPKLNAFPSGYYILIKTHCIKEMKIERQIETRAQRWK